MCTMQFDAGKAAATQAFCCVNVGCDHTVDFSRGHDMRHCPTECIGLFGNPHGRFTWMPQLLSARVP